MVSVDNVWWDSHRRCSTVDELRTICQWQINTKSFGVRLLVLSHPSLLDPFQMNKPCIFVVSFSSREPRSELTESLHYTSPSELVITSNILQCPDLLCAFSVTLTFAEQAIDFFTITPSRNTPLTNTNDRRRFERDSAHFRNQVSAPLHVCFFCEMVNADCRRRRCYV